MRIMRSKDMTLVYTPLRECEMDALYLCLDTRNILFNIYEHKTGTKLMIKKLLLLKEVQIIKLTLPTLFGLFKYLKSSSALLKIVVIIS